MKILTIIPYYFVWHYTVAIHNFIRIWSDFAWFIFNYFSIGFFAKSLFLPIGKIADKKVSVVSIFFLRCVGFFVRLIVIIISLFFIILLFFVGGALFFLWLFLPFVIGFLFFSGLTALIK
ncbi:MAG TPA: hypothetical protein PKA60_01825 [Candidatus Paceibacterota bacterium]|nr:hypothetical protein [Candidatus Paceibacterota bacterium]